MPWFRWKSKHDSTQQTAAEAAAQGAPPAELPAAGLEDTDTDSEIASDAATSAGGDDDDAEGTEETAEAAAARKRRRGTRGGRGRKKKPAGADGAEDAEEPAKPAKAAAEAKPGKASRALSQRAERRASARTSSSTRRRQPPRRAPLPKAKRELVVSVDVGEQRAAVIEDGQVAEVYLERPERRSIAGNIYLGSVDNVLPGMEAAFVEIGLEKNGFLYVDEIVRPELEGKRHGLKIQDLISRGQQVLVQAVKDPMKTKGARLTMEISLPGRFLVYVPNGEGLGVSRRLPDDERARLKDVLKQIAPKEGGVIVRTAAEGASAEDVERDLVFLQRLWKTVQARAKEAKAPALVYQEAELPLRLVRDLFAGDFEAAYIDHDRTFKRVTGYLKKTSPHMLERVHRYKDKPALFEAYGVEQQIRSTLNRRVDLPSGGYLIFDYAEAFTVVDVNTGRFVGSRSKSSGARLEDTIVKNNLEAVKEVVRQLRLRDIGGIIVIDFIDMANPKNREAVEEALRQELERDRTKTYVVEISPLGLVEMTRQNVTDGPREILTRKCPMCEGDGIVVADTTHAMDIERRLRELAAGAPRTQAFKVELHPRIAALVVGPGGRRLAAIEEESRRRFYVVPANGSGNGHVHLDHFQVLAEGKREDLAPQVPVAEGAEVELKLVEVGLHDPGAAVGKVDGYDVVVAGAAKLVGKKAKAHVGRALEGAAYATLLSGPEADAPITFESEAEKPTRAPAKRKGAEVGEVVDAEVEVGAPLEVEPAEDVETAAEGEEAAADGAEEAPADGSAPKKRTRRGSRGGRRRKKPAAGEEGAEEADGESSAGVEPETTGPAAAEASEPAEQLHEDAGEAPKPKPRARRKPKIHVPGAELGTDGDTSAAAPPADDAPTTESPGPDVVAADGEDGEDEAASAEGAPKKRSRRGSRGGKRRRKPAAAGDGNGSEADEEPEAAAEAEPAEESQPEYVPMSEWLDDFER